MSTTLDHDQRLRVLWQDAPFRRYSPCATCGCTHDENDRPLFVCGVNTDSLVCFACYVDEHDGKHPNYRYRRRARQAAV